MDFGGFRGGGFRGGFRVGSMMWRRGAIGGGWLAATGEAGVGPPGEAVGTGGNRWYGGNRLDMAVRCANNGGELTRDTTGRAKAFLGLLQSGEG